ncbi:DUF1292 domain-containing protein [Ructibacterium gallinarum]|uniref:DUF1292 domain-containing protein n=1 Tax=Ructibacterium gallinarum TaxID=2779355 RepID=A0A9D5LYH9_9FIRM|nr:DUF1292 domain-containing protein [Ructibacterium gallinarum]MBE5039232.1 DUF1292 domain-containing protein [Ructibacterium gallinarum]
MAELPENPHLVDLIDEDGNTVTFEHLDTVQYKGKDYVICIPYDDDEEVVTEVVIFLINKDKEDDCLEQVENPEILSAVYEIFKERNGEMFDFED